MRISTAQNILKVFGYLAVLISNLKKSVSQNKKEGKRSSFKFGSKWQFLYFKPFLSAMFVTIATVKVKLMSDFYTWVVLRMNQSEENGEKQLSDFGSRGGQISPLMHIAV